VPFDYHSAVLRALARVDRDSYAARGAVYDRMHAALLRHAHSANPPLSPLEIARQKKELNDAIRRIEFADQSSVAPDKLERSIVATADDDERPARHRPIYRRLIARVAIASVILGVVGVIALEPSSERWLAEVQRANAFIRSVSAAMTPQPPTRSAAPALERYTPPQRAVLYEEDPSNPVGITIDGQAFWRVDSNGVQSRGGADSTVRLELKIPERDLELTIRIRRNPDGNSAISHFVEFQFTASRGAPIDLVANVLGLVMKPSERESGITLAGQVAKVAPGVFLLGLSGSAADIERNIDLLKRQPWLDIPIVYNSGRRSILAVEKGVPGDNAIRTAFDHWRSQPRPN
jgi:hypothetical protein